MLRFLHGYMEGQWKGLVLHGMIDDTSGIKFHQNSDTPANNRFNELAAKGGKLYEIVRGCSRPFYIDRLQGGWTFGKYDYDRGLLREYMELCNGWMLGLQMHEWASNMNNDWGRIREGMKGNSKELGTEAILKATLRNFHTPGEIRSFLESASAEEYSTLKMPETAEDTVKQYIWLFTLRQQQYMQLLLPTDSFYMAIRHEISGGARALMPEIGAQIPFERWQIALTRGMAKAAGIPWGTYYEPWGGKPFGCCYYKRDFINEWGVISAESGAFPGGFYPNAGSSRALQKRIYFHSLLSGAQFISEEWGTSNTFYDWNDYELTPYGNVKKEFLSFAARNHGLGEAFTPIALVLPKEFEIFDLAYLSQPDGLYLGFPLKEPEKRRQFEHIKKVLSLLLGDATRQFGTEGHTIGNSHYGDVFDIVYEDAGENALAEYDMLIDLNINEALAFKYPGLSKRIIGSNDIGVMEKELDAALCKLMPCSVDGNISWILNHTGKGSWVLGLFNNEGVDRNMEHGDVFMHEADTTATIAAKGRLLDVLYGDKDALKHEENIWRYDIPAGQCALLEF